MEVGWGTNRDDVELLCRKHVLMSIVTMFLRDIPSLTESIEFFVINVGNGNQLDIVGRGVPASMASTGLLMADGLIVVSPQQPHSSYATSSNNPCAITHIDGIQARCY